MKQEVFLTKKNINQTNIAIIADIHYHNHYNKKILDSIKKQIIENKPDYLIIAGDLLDRSNYKYQGLLKLLEEIAKITILIIVLGNHDYYINNKDKTISNGVNQAFIKKLNNLNNTYLLRNEKIIIDNICFYGLDFPFDHFRIDKESYTSFKNIMDNQKDMLENKYYNITIIHSPVNIYKYIQRNPESNIALSDLIISGHTHNGCIPYCITNIINRVFKSNRSLASPYRYIFPKYAQGRVYKPKDGIIYEGLVKLSKSTRILSIFDFIFHKQIKMITIKKEPINEDK